MKQFTSVHDAGDVGSLVRQGLTLRQDPYSHSSAGRNKTLGLIFLNPSLRTRLSTQKAAANLGMNVMVMNLDKEGWAWEFADGAVMNGGTVEHIREAAAVIGAYCDVVGIRSFPTLSDRDYDYNETVLKKFQAYCRAPVVSLESATRHPLQSLADAMTIRGTWAQPRRPKVVLSWAPHVRALPQAVANSFSEWMLRMDVDFVITHPGGYELCEEFTGGARIVYDQAEALQGADYVYVKNWSSYSDYGAMPGGKDLGDWMLTADKCSHTNNAGIMHCLPVRRNVELGDDLLDGDRSMVIEQAVNRIYAAQCVLKNVLDGAAGGGQDAESARS